MLQRRTIRRALAQATRFARIFGIRYEPDTSSNDAPVAPPGPIAAHAPPKPSLDATTSVVRDDWYPEQATTCKPVQSSSVGEPPEPPSTVLADGTSDDPHHQRGLSMARAHRWNWAQRELEIAVRRLPDGPAADELETVRQTRRYLRVLKKRPRDAQLNLSLGKCYFELDMGEDAEEYFRRASNLAPQNAEAYYFLALEYCYRGLYEDAEHYYTKARALVVQLPPFTEFLAECGIVADPEDDAETVAS